jgi:HD-like signal output (HDOD) protein
VTILGAGVAYEDQVLRRLDRLPPFSPILNRLLATLAKEDVSFAELADVIEKDTVIAGNVLRLVNSALYGFQGTVNSVRHAVAILGLVKLRNAVMSLSISRMWRSVRTPEGWSSASFNVHSVATGILSDLLAQRLPAPYPEGAFVAGLLHDIGKLLIAISLPREYAMIQALFEAGEQSIEECEREIIGTTHAVLSGAALGKWNLPPPIQRAVTFHHAPDEANDGQLDLSHVVHAADQLAIDLGHAVLSAGSKQGKTSEKTLETLGISGHIPRLLEQFQQEFEVLRGFF